MWPDDEDADDEYPFHLEGPEAFFWREEDRRREQRILDGLAMVSLLSSLGPWDLRRLRPFRRGKPFPESRW